MKRLISTVLCGMLMACNCVQADSYTWDLVRTDPMTGDYYVLDHDLTSDDCWSSKALYETNDQATAGILTCEQRSVNG